MISLPIVFLFSVNLYSQYCVPNIPVIGTDIGTVNLEFHTLSNPTTPSVGYSDFTGLPATNLILGESYNLNVTVNNVGSNEDEGYKIKAWIDWNGDGDFADANEKNIDYSGLGLGDTYTELINVPIGATIGNTRMRVAVTASDFDEPDTCSQITGDIEDYTVNISTAYNMSFISAEVFQDTFICIPQEAINQQVIGLKIMTDGNLTPLNLDEIEFSTNGSTNPLVDVSAANIWFTGNNNCIDFNNLYGTQNLPNGMYNVIGNQQLNNNENFVWITYDVLPGAIIGNDLDCEITEITLNTGAVPIAPSTTPIYYDISNSFNSFVPNETHIWHFGSFAGIDFNCSPPLPINGGLTSIHNTSAWEASSAISDANGNLLFYTDGVVIFNKKHNITPNGSGLTGHGSSAQCMIVPQPESDSLYYVFTNDIYGAGNMAYSIFDITLDNDLGDIIPGSKNISLTSPSAERVTAVHHCNQEDIWVILHNSLGDFHSYLLTSNGLEPAIVSNLGHIASVGQLMASPNGNLLAINGGSLAIFDFNAETGEVCNQRILNNSNETGAYGCSFSSDGSKLYAGDGEMPFVDVVQYDINAGNTAAIIASKQTLGQPQFTASQMQIGPDERIYISKMNNDYMSIIDNINSLTPTLVDNGFNLGNNSGSAGVPNFVQSWFLNPSYVNPNLISADFTSTTECFGNTTNFTNTSIYNSECPKFTWYFDDPASGTNDTSYVENPSHLFSSAGVFEVTLILEDQCQVDTIIQSVLVSDDVTGTDVQAACGDFTWIDGITYNTSTNTPTFTIVGGSSYGCDSTVTLDLTINNSVAGTDLQTACEDFIWIDGVTYNTSTNTPTHTIVGGASNGCDSIVTLDLTINNPAAGTDVQIACEDFTWIDGVTYNTSTNTPTHAIVGGASNGCDSIVTLNLTINNAATSTDVQTACGDFTWIDGVTYIASTSTPTHTIVGGASNGCDSIITLDLTINNSVMGTDIQTACDDYTWIDGVTYNSSTNTPTFTIVGGAANGCDSIVTLDLTINTPSTTINTFNECEGFNTTVGSNTYNTTGVFTDVINGCDTIITDLTINPAPTLTLIKSDDNCGEGKGSVSAIANSSNPPITYNWSTGSSDSTINSLPSGTYAVTVNDALGCSATDSIGVQNFIVDCDYFVYLPNGFTPNGDQNNDILYVRGKGITSFTLNIYNRWGNKVFVTDELNTGWDGTFKGEPQNTAVFVYTIEGAFENGETFKESGDISLLR